MAVAPEPARQCLAVAHIQAVRRIASVTAFCWLLAAPMSCCPSLPMCLLMSLQHVSLHPSRQVRPLNPVLKPNPGGHACAADKLVSVSVVACLFIIIFSQLLAKQLKHPFVSTHRTLVCVKASTIFSAGNCELYGQYDHHAGEC